MSEAGNVPEEGVENDQIVEPAADSQNKDGSVKIDSLILTDKFKGPFTAAVK